ncbi:hypothetical protein [Rhabdochromatium marinum]|uniref:hypothetical protein n=1 Tax=Rhabdochromatium marinum TaxID=48729 RepID=UPI00190750D2|nr:hypothetical protein [Rhabdochromatium marinum]MBK1648604.1 hypothetical protein [Rhabdochromatium marinum]
MSKIGAAVVWLGLLGLPACLLGAESGGSGHVSHGLRLAAVDGLWVLVIMLVAVAGAVVRMLPDRQLRSDFELGLSEPRAAAKAGSDGGTARGRHHGKVAVGLALAGGLLLALSTRFLAGVLVGGSLLALAWVLAWWQRRGTFAWHRRCSVPALWVQGLVLVVAIGGALAWWLSLTGSDSAAMARAIDSMLSMLSWPLGHWLAGLLFAAALIEIAGRLLAELPFPPLHETQERAGPGE